MDWAWALLGVLFGLPIGWLVWGRALADARRRWSVDVESGLARARSAEAEAADCTRDRDVALGRAESAEAALRRLEAGVEMTVQRAETELRSARARIKSLEVGLGEADGPDAAGRREMAVLRAQLVVTVGERDAAERRLERARNESSANESARAAAQAAHSQLVVEADALRAEVDRLRSLLRVSGERDAPLDR